jgi:glucosyl-dolichyl phosphate glucuronosyltransferase
MIKVSIVVTFYNAKTNLRPCLESILKQDTEPKSFEVILIDNNSTDTSAESISELVAKYDNIHLLEEKKAGVVAARNCGIVKASGEVIVFLAANMTLKKDFLSQIEWIYRDQSTVMHCGPVHKSTTTWFHVYKGLWNLGSSSKEIHADTHFNGCNMSFRADKLKKFDINLRRDNHKASTIAEYVTVKRLLSNEGICRYEPQAAAYIAAPSLRSWKQVIKNEFLRGQRAQPQTNFTGVTLPSVWSEHTLTRLLRFSQTWGRSLQWLGIKGRLTKKKLAKKPTITLGQKNLITVAICTYNRSDILANCLEALHHQTVHKKAFEILVVDNNSNDGTAELVKEWQSKITNLNYIFEITSGLSTARNRAIHEAKGEIIAFIDDDALVCSDYIEALSSTFSRYQDAISVCGRVVLQPSKPFPAWMPSRLRAAYAEFEAGSHEIVLNSGGVGANMAFRKKCFVKYGFFNTELGRKKGNLLSMEDRDYLNHVQSQYGQCIYSPKAMVNHCVGIERISRIFFIRRYYWQAISEEAIAEYYSPLRKKSIVQQLCKVLKIYGETAVEALLSTLILLVYSVGLLCKKKAHFEVENISN